MDFDYFQNEYSLCNLAGDLHAQFSQHWEIPEFRALLQALDSTLGYSGDPKVAKVIRTLAIFGPAALDRIMVGCDSYGDVTPVGCIMGWDPYLLPLAVRAGADINRPHIGGENTEPTTMLCEAARLGLVDLAEQLIDMGADTSIAYNDRTPLFLAVRLAERSMVELLINKGAEVTPVALEFSLWGKDTGLSLFLLLHTKDPASFDARRLAFLRPEVLAMFLDNTSYSINAPREESGNLLWIMAQRYYGYNGANSKECVQLLLDRGADVDLAGEYKDRIIQDFL